MCPRFHVPGMGESRLTAVHCRSRHDCFMRPGPPNFFMSRQKWQSPHSVRTQARQRRQRVRRRRAPAPGPRLLDDIGGVSNAEGCRQMVVRSERPAKPGLRVSWPQAHSTSDGAELLLLPSKKVSLLVCVLSRGPLPQDLPPLTFPPAGRRDTEAPPLTSQAKVPGKGFLSAALPQGASNSYLLPKPSIPSQIYLLILGVGITLFPLPFLSHGY